MGKNRINELVHQASIVGRRSHGKRLIEAADMIIFLWYC